MKLNLKKCKEGDKVQLRNGTIATIFNNTNEDNYRWPFYHDNGNNNRSFHAVDINGKSCIDMNKCDIVKVITKHVPKKLSKYGGIRKDEAATLWNIAVNSEEEEVDKFIEKFRIHLAKIVRKHANKKSNND